MMSNSFSTADLSRIIEMAWEDRTPFEAIAQLYGLTEPAVIKLMRHELKPGSFRLWRARVSGRRSKHLKLRNPEISRAYCPSQYKR
ncbi:TIGR03643 family protein [Arsukibacterium sp.]|uniref:TIGR03643 family protein n=1 Tax=Arsukibacterium sp. TaxID=1977258 RepID=UPI00299E5B3F|nr:TIGR03643 family protein [Arsukibacterium sp.]MDX1677415.1 TIGR03643 family protein [Arsukibacterium sp.]